MKDKTLEFEFFMCNRGYHETLDREFKCAGKIKFNAGYDKLRICTCNCHKEDV